MPEAPPKQRSATKVFRARVVWRGFRQAHSKGFPVFVKFGRRRLTGDAARKSLNSRNAIEAMEGNRPLQGHSDHSGFKKFWHGRPGDSMVLVRRIRVNRLEKESPCRSMGRRGIAYRGASHVVRILTAGFAWPAGGAGAKAPAVNSVSG